MTRVQDIQTEDLALKNQYTQDMTNGDYAGMSGIISTNPQLDTKIFDADKINDIADSLTAQQNNYFNNVPDYMAALEAQYNALINEFKNAHDWDVGEEYILDILLSYITNYIICILTKQVVQAICIRILLIGKR